MTRTLKTIGSLRDFIKAIDEFLTDDVLEDVEFSEIKKRPITQAQAKYMRDKLSKLYRMAHVIAGTCTAGHPDWHKEAQEFISHI